MLSLLLLAAISLLAYSNGANDNFKGVASLFGSRTLGYRAALWWGTSATLLGSVASAFLAKGLLVAFSAKGLVPSATADNELFLLAVAGGAAGTVMLATRLGFPISTTHSLVGAITGAGLLASGGALEVDVLASTFFVPLLVSPFVAIVSAGGLYALLHHGRVRLGIRKDQCLCLGQVAVAGASMPLAAMSSGGGATASDRGPGLHVLVDSEERCVELYGGRFLGVSWQRIVDTGHLVSAGLVSFARGLNDTPKIAALLLLVPFVEARGGLVVVGVTMALGGLLGARRVAMTMGRRITAMNHGQGLAANVATGVLVIWASRLGLPVSTTHVAVGSLFGVGLTTGQADFAVVHKIVLSWVVTLPCAAALSAAAYAIATQF